MKVKNALALIFLVPVSLTYADAQVINTQEVCEKRITAFKSGLEASIKAKQNVDTAQAELDKINALPNTLPACEKQKRIPALANTDEASKQANDALQDRKISPANDK